ERRRHLAITGNQPRTLQALAATRSDHGEYDPRAFLVERCGSATRKINPRKQMNPSENSGASSALAVDACSLPVSSVLYLIERWGKNAGQWKSDVEYHKRPIFKDDPAAAISVASC